MEFKDIDTTTDSNIHRVFNTRLKEYIQGNNMENLLEKNDSAEKDYHILTGAVLSISVMSTSIISMGVFRFGILKTILLCIFVLSILIIGYFKVVKPAAQNRLNGKR